MMLAKVFKPAGAIATTVCAVATGIAVNLSILSAGPDGTGNLAVGTQRATTTSAAPNTTSTAAPNRTERILVHVAAPAPSSALVASNSFGGGVPTAPPTRPPNTSGAPSTSPPKTTPPTVTPRTGHGTSTYKVGNAGTVSAHWLSPTTIEVVARPAAGWSVSLSSWHEEKVTATFVKGDRGIVWKGRVDGHHIHTEVHHFTRDSGTGKTTTTSAPRVAAEPTNKDPRD
jgi:hypothetical protein